MFLSNNYIDIKGGNLRLLKEGFPEEKSQILANLDSFLNFFPEERLFPEDSLSGLQLREEYRFSIKRPTEGRTSFSLKVLEKNVILLRNENEGVLKKLDDQEKKLFSQYIETMDCINLPRMLNGSRFEHFVYEGRCKKKSFWNDWKEKSQASLFDYVFRIYPVVFECLEVILPNDAHIVELCGGDGNFAKTLFDRMENKINKYHLFDLNEKSLKKAELNLSAQIAKSKTVVEQVDVAEADFNLYTREKVDIVVGVGALTACVLPNRATALKVLKNAETALKAGGYLILSGHASSLISASDIEKVGLVVSNTFAPRISTHFYIARKTSREASLIN